MTIKEWIQILFPVAVYAISFYVGYTNLKTRFEEHEKNDDRRFKESGEMLSDKNSIWLAHDVDHHERINHLETTSAGQAEIIISQKEYLVRMEGKMDKLLDWIIKQNQV